MQQQDTCKYLKYSTILCKPFSKQLIQARWKVKVVVFLRCF